jgi:small subunit ribosomal protein S14
VAKKSKIAKNEQRKVVVARYAQRRAELKAVMKDPAAPIEAKVEARDALNRMPRDASPTRVRNRDRLDGRPRGHLRRFGLSRVNFRQLAHRGELPGVKKASW